jgi:hypothetical protein
MIIKYLITLIALKNNSKSFETIMGQYFSPNPHFFKAKTKLMASRYKLPLLLYLNPYTVTELFGRGISLKICLIKMLIALTSSS